MNRFTQALLTTVLVVMAATPQAQTANNSVPPVDAPELAALGPNNVGVRSLNISNPNQPDLPKAVMTGGKVMASDRKLKVELWYPATVGADAPRVSYAANLPNKGGAAIAQFQSAGMAVRDAQALPNAAGTNKRYPLVLVSHGFGGWSTFLAYLAENLASKGYVVASIDHDDQPFTDGGSFGLSFGSVLIHRARDQAFVLQHLTTLAELQGDAIGQIIDAKNIGVIGYSMGGYGALATAGAGYDAASANYKQLPAPVIAPYAHGNAEYEKNKSSAVRAVVLMAPWGGQPANRAWSAESMKAIKAPLLFVVGDQDDIVDYKDGVNWLFNAATSSNRHMLVFQNTRHNIGGHGVPAGTSDFSTREYFDEPVWRKDRIMAINQHFVSAFLDRHLKGDMTKNKFLALSPVKSNDAKWPLAFGQSSGANYADGAGATTNYWPGFQRRWAVGLEMHSKAAGE